MGSRRLKLSCFLYTAVFCLSFLSSVIDAAKVDPSSSDNRDSSAYLDNTLGSSQFPTTEEEEDFLLDNGRPFTETELYRFREILPMLPRSNGELQRLREIVASWSPSSSMSSASGVNLRDPGNVQGASQENDARRLRQGGDTYRTRPMFPDDSRAPTRRMISDVDENLPAEDVPALSERPQVQGWQGCLRDYDMVMLPETRNYEKIRALMFNYENPLLNPLPVPEVPRANPVARQIVDSNGRRPTGLYQGALHWVGAVDLCQTVGVRYLWTPNGTDQGQGDEEVRLFKGKYARLDIPADRFANVTADSVLKLALGVCAPDTCTDNEIVRYVTTENEFFIPTIVKNTLPRNVTFIYSGQDTDLANDPLAIFTYACVFAIVFVIVVTSCYDGWGRSSIIRSKIQRQTGRDKNRPFTYQDIREAQSYLYGKPGAWDRLETFIAGFSVYTNSHQIYTPKPRPYRVPVIDGLKFLTFFWLAYGLSFVAGVLYQECWTTYNVIDAVRRYLDEWSTMIIISVTYTIPAMLYCSGFSCVQLFYKCYDKNEKNLSFLLIVRYILHRYWSIIPTLATLLMLYTLCYPYLADGPLTSPVITDAENCKETWWLPLLLFHNLFKLHDQCTVWSFFFAVLWQLHLASLFVVVPMVIKPAAGYVMAALMYIAHIIVNSIEQKKYRDGEINYLQDILQVPWTHAGAHIIGMVMAMALRQADRNKKWHWSAILMLWLLSVTGILVVIFAPWDHLKSLDREWTKEGRIAFDVLAPQLLALSMGWITYACWKGYGGIFDGIFRWGTVTWMSRMMLAMTIGIGPIMQLNFYLRRTCFYVHENHMKYVYFSHLLHIFFYGNIIAYIVTFPLSRGLTAALRATNRLELFLWGRHPDLLRGFTGNQEEDFPKLERHLGKDHVKAPPVVSKVDSVPLAASVDMTKTKSAALWNMDIPLAGDKGKKISRFNDDDDVPRSSPKSGASGESSKSNDNAVHFMTPSISHSDPDDSVSRTSDGSSEGFLEDLMNLKAEQLDEDDIDILASVDGQSDNDKSSGSHR